MSRFNYSLVPRCIVEATELALVSYLTPIFFLTQERPGVKRHKPTSGLIHESAIVIAVYQHLLMHPELNSHDYDIRWEHQLNRSHGRNPPRADLYLGPARSEGGRKTWVEVGDMEKAKALKDASKLLRNRKSDHLFVLALDLNPPKARQSIEKVRRRVQNLAATSVAGGSFAHHPDACRLLRLPLPPLDNPPRVGFGLLKVLP